MVVSLSVCVPKQTSMFEPLFERGELAKQVIRPVDREMLPTTDKAGSGLSTCGHQRQDARQPGPSWTADPSFIVSSRPRKKQAHESPGGGTRKHEGCWRRQADANTP